MQPRPEEREGPPLTPELHERIREFAACATAEVGERLLRDFGRVSADRKADGTLVTAADRWADETLGARVRRAFPGHQVLSEEGDAVFHGGEWCWVIDPLDGTTNFARGIPVWAVSLGLLHRGTPVYGHVRVPPLARLFEGTWREDADLGEMNGSSMNDRPIRTSPDEPDQTRFFTICSRSTSVLRRPFPCKIRMLGSAAHNFLTVACGAALGGVEATPKVWDLAGAWPILLAAGGEWVPLADSPFPLIEGADYTRRSFPMVALAHADLGERFLPLVRQAFA
ncbi:MAG: inositol monophosphatase family protein [Candidatus Eisenbacteria bacterium]